MAFRSMKELACGPILVKWKDIWQYMGFDQRTCKKIAEKQGFKPLMAFGNHSFFSREETRAFLEGLASGVRNTKGSDKINEI